MFTTEGDQVLGMTRLAPHPQEAVFQPPAFEVALEFSLHITRQFPALLSQVGSERRIILLNDPIEQGLLGPVTLVTACIPIRGGHPGRRVGHDPRPCNTVYLYSLSLGCRTLKRWPKCQPVPVIACQCRSLPLYYQHDFFRLYFQ